MTIAAQRVRCPFQVNRVPQHDGCRNEIEAAGSVALLLEAAVADFAQAVEEHRPGERVARLALVQPSVHAATQLDALQPVPDEQRTLDTPQFAPGQSLGRSDVGSCRDQRSRHGTLLDRGGQPQDVVPMRANMLDVERAADHRFERVIGGIALGDVELSFTQWTG